MLQCEDTERTDRSRSDNSLEGPDDCRMFTRAVFTMPNVREMLGRHRGTHAGLGCEDAPGRARRAKA